MNSKAALPLGLLLLAYASGCATPLSVAPPPDTGQEPALPSGRLSPDGQWILTQTQTSDPPGRRLLVAPRDTMRYREVLSGLPGARYQTLWSSPPAPPLLVVVDPRPHRHSSCHVYDPVARKIWRIDKQANADMDRTVPEPLEKRQTRARAVSPDGSKILLDITGTIRNAPFYKVYVVESATGAIVRTYRHEYLTPEQWWK